LLVKGGLYLEALGNVDVIAFDKTGTITTGESEVTDIIAFVGFTEERVPCLAASVECRSEHPLAEAIGRTAKADGVELENVCDFEALTGMGATAKFNGDTCIIGNPRLMKQLGVDLAEHQSILDSLQEDGKTVVIVAFDGRPAGIIALRDTVRHSAGDVFHELRELGIERIVMITGDNEKSARAVAEDLDIDEYYAELLPQDKVDMVRALIERFGSRVAFVGDGVNDAPALAAASVGIAMGAVGSSTAIETADVALMGDDLRRLPYALRLGRSAHKTVRQNVFFSLAVILALVVSTLMGGMRLSLGVFGHEASALIVIANGMRLLRFK
jgi:Zn2+/Cd2+-exporting ATPase